MDKNNQLVEGLKLNNISNENIELFLKAKLMMEKLGFEFDNYDNIDNDFLITFSVKN